MNNQLNPIAPNWNWVAGILLTIMLGGGGIWGTYVVSQLSHIRQGGQVNAERISRIEAYRDGNEVRLKSLEAHLARIESKIDELIAQKLLR